MMMNNRCPFWFLVIITQCWFISRFLAQGKNLKIIWSTKPSRLFRSSLRTDAPFAISVTKRHLWTTQLPKHSQITTNEETEERDTVYSISTMAPTANTDNLSTSSAPQNAKTDTKDRSVDPTNLKRKRKPRVAYYRDHFIQSCSQKCSNETTFDRYKPKFTRIDSVCSCDRACDNIFMDCCGDYAKKCLTPHDDYQPDDFVHRHQTLMHCETKLKILQEGIYSRILGGVWMVTKCPRYWLDGDIRTKCQTPSVQLQVENYDSYIPVFGKTSKLTFRNKYCALCNNVTQYDFWKFLFPNNMYFQPSYYTLESFKTFLDNSLPYFKGIRPNNGQPIRYCRFPNTINSCPNGSNNSLKCINGEVGLVKKGRKVFKNKNCALCNEVENASGVGPSRIITTYFGLITTYQEISLITTSCLDHHIYDSFVGQCRRYYKITWKFQNNITTEKYQVVLSLDDIGNFSMQDNKESVLRKEISHFIKVNESQISNEEIISKASEVLVCFTISLTPLQSVIIGMKDQLKFDDTGLKKLFPMFFGAELEVFGRRRILYSYRVRQLSCNRRYVYRFGEYEIQNGHNIYIRQTEVIYKPNEYYNNTNNAKPSVTVCLKNSPGFCSNVRSLNLEKEYYILPNLTLIYNSTRYNYGNYVYTTKNKGTVAICEKNELPIIKDPRLTINNIFQKSKEPKLIPVKNISFISPPLSCINQRVYGFGEYVELSDQRIYVNATGTLYKPGEYQRNSENERSNVSICLQKVPARCNGTSIKLKPSEYRMENLTLIYKSKKLKYGKYAEINGTFYICVQSTIDYTTIYTSSTKSDSVLGLITFVGFVLSLLFLSALIVTYSIFQELRTLPGKNVLALSISLFLAEFSWLCRLAFLKNGAGCFIIAILNHYSFLVSFAASSVIAFHSCLILGKQVSLKRSNSANSKTFYIYSLIAWGIPALFVLTSVLLDHFGWFVTDYGRSDMCWLGTSQSKIFFFILPIGVSLLFNVFLFAFSAVRFLRNQSSIAQSLASNVVKKRKIENILICVKLSTLMSFSWLFGLMQVIVETETVVFAYLFVIFVSFQGVFICVAFVFKTRCLQLYRSLWANTISRKTVQTKSYSGKNHETRETVVENATFETKL